ncbi:MOSC domain-containing protein [Modestobacter italicus]|uniref:MOSC domain-containing protein n=1 Tax=Modestobacter italicus (strain DSM 44449 / CECT 9708 / BC 501) TaxID=2732864 RepID=UPI001E3E04CE|nr:MOSC domain-containing protein [Modestobacter marinus]
MAAVVTGRVREIWTAPAAAAPMVRSASVRALAGVGLEGDRYADGGGTWAGYPLQEKQLTLIDADEVAAVAREVGVPLTPGATRRNLVTAGIALPSLVGRYFAVGEVLAFGTKRCPPCRHLEQLTGWKLVKALAARGGVNAAVLVGGTVAEGDVVRLVPDEEAADRGAPVGADRPVPRIVALPD